MTKVMIAEDDLFTADMLKDNLVENGYEVCGIARTVDRAVELGERHNPDLAILDIRLAEGGLGTDISTRIKDAARWGSGRKRTRWQVGSHKGRRRGASHQTVPARRRNSRFEDRPANRQHRRSFAAVPERFLCFGHIA